MNRNMFFCLVLVACSSRAVTLEDLPFETVVETAGESTPKLVSYGKALALAEGALQASWAVTGTVSRAQMADMLLSPSGRTWLEIAGGSTYIVEVTNSTSVYVVSTSGVGYNGPAAGTVWGKMQSEPTYGGTMWLDSDDNMSLVLSSDRMELVTAITNGVWAAQSESEIAFPCELLPSGDGEFGTFTIDWLPITNRFEVAKQEPTVLLISGSIAGHNADTNTTAHAGLFSGKQTAETVVSGAVGVASAGNRYFWTSATNVVLRVNLASGQVVNLAKLNNTATNSITAIGAVGWEWTGGKMTNTITAGKSMTFGFLVDAATGKTNAYATGVSK